MNSGKRNADKQPFFAICQMICFPIVFSYLLSGSVLSIGRQISYIRDSNKGYDKRALESKEREKIWTNWPVRDANV